MSENKWRFRGEDLKGTETEKNLLAAFAGESEARNKYTFFASKAKKVRRKGILRNNHLGQLFGDGSGGSIRTRGTDLVI